MKGRQGQRFTRRRFLKLAIATSAALLGGELARHQGWLPGGVEGWPDPESLIGNLDWGNLDRYRQQRPPGAAADTRPRVAIVRGDDPAAMVRNAVALAGGLDQVVRSGATVLIKPNLTIPSASGLGNVTDSRVVRATIELCQQAGATRVLVGDGAGGGDTEQIMRQAGYEPVLKATGAGFVDLNRDQVVNRRLAGAAGLPEYGIAKTAAEADVLISLAVLKVHDEAIVSLSCKNLIGITALSVYGKPRQKLHDAGVQRVIADIVRLRPPDFAIVDGIVGLEGDSPMRGAPVRMNLVIAGRNAVSVDAVGARVMDCEPQQIEQLTLLAGKGLGEIDTAKIAVKGTPIADVQRHFSR